MSVGNALVVSGVFLSVVACTGGVERSSTATSGADPGGMGGAAQTGDATASAGGSAGHAVATVSPPPDAGSGLPPTSPPPGHGSRSPTPPTECPAAPSPTAAWTELPPPAAVPPGFFVTDAWPAGVDDFFFVGSDLNPDPAATPSSTRRVLHWSHGCWSIELAVTGGPHAQPQISGTAPDDVWMIASDVIYHRDASGWSLVDPGLLSLLGRTPDEGVFLHDVQARTRNDVWFAEGFATLHLLNGQWHVQEVTVGAPSDIDFAVGRFDVVSIVAENDVWMGGSLGQVGNTQPTSALFHFDGQGWTIHPVGFFDVEALWPAGGADTFWLTVGASALDPQPLKRFAADVATVQAVDGWEDGISATSLWGRGPNDVWMAGEDVAHFDGTSWSRAADAPDAARDRSIFHLQSVVTGDANATWLTGVGPRFFRKAAGAAP